MAPDCHSTVVVAKGIKYRHENTHMYRFHTTLSSPKLWSNYQVILQYVVINQTNFGDRHVVRSAYHNTTAYILKSSRTESLK